jgi:hypothetical protein
MVRRSGLKLVICDTQSRLRSDGEARQTGAGSGRASGTFVEGAMEAAENVIEAFKGNAKGCWHGDRYKNRTFKFG